MSKLPVLVTGGAGYIGSHAVLALKDAGWPVAVIDDLSNGAREAVPSDIPFYEGNIADRALVDRIFREQGTQAIMPPSSPELARKAGQMIRVVMLSRTQIPQVTWEKAI